MSGDSWITLATLLGMLVLLATNRMPPAAVVLGATTTLLVTGVIDTTEAFAGFSNPAPLTVAALYVLARAAQRTALLSVLTRRLLSDTPGRGALARLVVPTAGASTVMNNTPLVAMLIPDVQTWCRSRGLPASRYLLPISYAGILGGAVTVLGTSTNLIISGLLQERDGKGLLLFDLLPISGVAAVVGLVVLLVVSPWLLPDRVSAPERSEVESRDFTIQLEVEENGPLDGRTVAEADLRDLDGVFLVAIDRGGMTISPVAPDRRIGGGDVLTFVGRVEEVVDLQRTPGLRSTEQRHLLALEGTEQAFYEAVVGRSSPLVGRTVRQARFRGTYQAAVLAVHRAGQRVDAKLGEVRLRHGDTLLLVAGPDFRESWQDHQDFVLVARLGGEPPTVGNRAPFVGLVAAAVVVSAMVDAVPLLHAALVGAGALVVGRVLTFAEARDAVDLDVILLIGASFGLGAAMQTTGLAAEVADLMIRLFDGFGSLGMVFGVVLATSLLTEVITNNAAAVVMFPIAMAVAEPAGIEPRYMAMALAASASSSFLTPIGYQTNTMVYGPGGYRFGDYLRVGIPVSIGVFAAVTVMTVVVG